MTVARHKFLNSHFVKCRSRMWLPFTLLWLLVASGCGDSAYIPVVGVVKLDGQPVTGAAITFSPELPGEASVAVTDAEGKFAIHTAHDQTGAVAGKYRIAVFRAEMIKLQPHEKQPSGDIALEGHRMQWIVPKKYSRIETSGLAVEVQPSMSPVILDLSGQ